MHSSHRGYDITITRESKGGDAHYSIFRQSDGLEVVSDFTSDQTPIAEQMGWLKTRVDSFIKSKGESEMMAHYWDD